MFDPANRIDPIRRAPPLVAALALSLLGACAGTGVGHAAFGPSDGEPLSLADLRPVGRQDQPAAAKLERPAKNGFYLTGMFVRSEVASGDFDGESILVGPSDVILLPELDPGTGWGGALGWRFDSGAFEFSYLRSDHDASFLGASGDARLCTFNMDWKGYFNTDSKLQPNVLIGFSVPTLVVEDGSSDGVQVGDGEFIGLGLNLGVGLDYQFTPGLGLVSQAVYRLAELTSADGVVGSGTLGDNLDVSGLDLRLGLRFTF